MSEPIYVTRPSMPPFEEYTEEIRELWDTRILTNSAKKHQELERQLKKYLEVPQISLFCNGHLALQVAIRALGLTGEVITTPFTFASTTHALVECGITPVFCDIDPLTLTMDPSKIEALITPRTSAILPVHVYGTPCDTEAISDIAHRHNLKVIYDAAHTFGVKKNGTSIGNFGDISMFSFHATKVFHTVEGGCLTYSDPNLKERIERIRQFGIQGDDNAAYVGTNAKMTEVHAAMGLCNLRHIEEYFEGRKRAFTRYIEQLKHVEGLRFVHMPKQVEFNYAYFPVLVDAEKFGATRDELCSWLQKNQVFPRKYFSPLTSDFDCYQGRFDSSKTPVAKEISSKVLVLPLFSDLVQEQVDRICRLIVERGQEI